MISIAAAKVPAADVLAATRLQRTVSHQRQCALQDVFGEPHRDIDRSLNCFFL